MNPLATCSNWRVEPRMKWTLTRDETGTSQTFRWRGALPGLYFPRIPAWAMKYSDGQSPSERHVVSASTDGPGSRAA